MKLFRILFSIVLCGNFSLGHADPVAIQFYVQNESPEPFKLFVSNYNENPSFTLAADTLPANMTNSIFVGSTVLADKPSSFYGYAGDKPNPNNTILIYCAEGWNTCQYYPSPASELWIDGKGYQFIYDPFSKAFEIVPFAAQK